MPCTDGETAAADRLGLAAVRGLPAGVTITDEGGGKFARLGPRLTYAERFGKRVGLAGPELVLDDNRGQVSDADPSTVRLGLNYRPPETHLPQYLCDGDRTDFRIDGCGKQQSNQVT